MNAASTITTRKSVTLEELQRRFILSRLERGVSPASVRYYERCHKKLIQYAACLPMGEYNMREDAPDVLGAELSDPQKSEMPAHLGKYVPVEVLDSEGFHSLAV